MGLITKPPSWAHCTTNFPSTPAITVGTNFTAGLNDADAASVAILTNVTHDIEYLVLGFHATGGTGLNTSMLLDLLVDPAGGSTWATDPLINDLLVGQAGTNAQATSGLSYYHFPIWLKSGHSLGVRARTAHTSDVTTGRIAVLAYGGNANPGSWWCGQHVTTIGVDPSISQGTNHTPGNSAAFSTWVNFGSALPAPAGAFQFFVQGTNTDATQQSLSYHFEFGIGSTRIGPPILRTTNTTEMGWAFPTGPIFYSAPSAAQLMVRAACSVTAETLDVAAYAVH
jgi:hypothetical protein